MDRKGHLYNTPENRKLVIATAASLKHFLGTCAWGNRWYAQTLSDGRQIWTSVRRGFIRNAGVNDVPRVFPGLHKSTT